MSTTFSGLGLRSELQQALKQNGVAVPTPIQEQSIPILLGGKDIVAQAQTGTGKTLAFLLPILERVKPAQEHVQALILTPTRELAIQITDEAHRLAPVVGSGVLAVYGGQDVEAQIRKLSRAPHLVVATPGRLLDHLRRGTIDLSRLSMLVLDEADQMLHMGFLTEVEQVIEQIPYKRQTMLFSATISTAVRNLASRYLRDPEDVRIQGKAVTLEGIRQLIVETTDRAKQQTLFQLIRQQRPFMAVAFCRTKIRAKKLTEAMAEAGFEVDELHGDLTQAKREQVMRRFREAKLQVLVATDVAARGLDVEGVTHVYNYDAPPDAESYIHRIGRTGRAGAEGMAVTLATPGDRTDIEKIERGIHASIEKKSMRDYGVTPGGQLLGSSEPSDYNGRASHDAGPGSRSKAAKGGPRTAPGRRGRGAEPAAQSGARSTGGRSGGRGAEGRSSFADSRGGGERAGGRSDFGRSGGRGADSRGSFADSRAGGERAGGRSDFGRSGGRGAEGRSSFADSRGGGERTGGRSDFGRSGGKGNTPAPGGRRGRSR